MDQPDLGASSVIEEFLSHLRPITQLALLTFMKKNSMLTAQQIVVLSDAELEKLLEVGNISYLHQNPQYEVNTVNYKGFLRSATRELWLAACKVSFPISELSTLESSFVSYSSLPRLKFGDKVLDEKVSACFPAKGIVDVVGEASSGKTQFCLHLLMNCIMPVEQGGLGKGALYIHTEGEFSHKRWEQLKQFRLLSMPNGQQLLEDQLVIQRISTVEEMDMLLERIRPLIRVKNSAAVFIDSIAALVRDLPTDAKQSTLYRWTSHLQETSDDTGIPIITTNQVVDFIDEPSRGASSSHSHPKSSYGVAKRHSSFMATGRRVLPALGLRWSELVNTRISLTRTSQRYDGPVQLSKAPADDKLGAQSRVSESFEDYIPQSKRKMLFYPHNPTSSSTPQSWEDASVIVRHIQVLFSPIVAEIHADYFIDGAGLHGIS